ncbi:hypothetical protein TNCV_3524491 [Trichonephila clavipes]|uniref:Transposase IS30-like HTH domain-containing protein n=1 Tax=Trichonephila clavipes TaxID=2585209 RepID=A0A8X6VG44_TRICX|nr:hypothetical protein TNCV_3524491 [Trichonephila clavipes]
MSVNTLFHFFKLPRNTHANSSRLHALTSLLIFASRRKQRSAFDQVSEFGRGRIMAYRDCGLPFREIGSRVGRNQTAVMRMDM